MGPGLSEQACPVEPTARRKAVQGWGTIELGQFDRRQGVALEMAEPVDVSKVEQVADWRRISEAVRPSDGPHVDEAGRLMRGHHDVAQLHLVHEADEHRRDRLKCDARLGVCQVPCDLTLAEGCGVWNRVVPERHDPVLNTRRQGEAALTGTDKPCLSRAAFTKCHVTTLGVTERCAGPTS